MAFDPKGLGDMLVIVGKKQIATGTSLNHSATKVRSVADLLQDNGRVDRSLGSMENGTRATRNLLTPISNALHSTANVLDGISIPTIEFQTQSVDLPVVGRFRFVSSISLSSSRLFRSAAASINSVADDVDDIRGALLSIAAAMADLQNEMPNIRREVLGAAKDMEQGGASLIEAGTVLEEEGILLGGSGT